MHNTNSPEHAWPLTEAGTTNGHLLDKARYSSALLPENQLGRLRAVCQIGQIVLSNAFEFHEAAYLGKARTQPFP